MRARVPVLGSAAVVFGATALAGPALWQVNAGLESNLSSAGREFMDDLLLLLWPARLLAMGWDATAPLKEALYVYCGQMGAFVLLGLVVGVAARSRGMTVAVYWCLLLFLLLLASWSAGFDGADVPWAALASAAVLYAHPFWLVDRAARRHERVDERGTGAAWGMRASSVRKASMFRTRLD